MADEGLPTLSRRAVLIFDLVALLLVAALVALGTWQVHRRAWKLDLIDRVESRIGAFPVEAPARERWPGVTAPSDEYRHVRVSGRFLPDRTTLVQALTERGPGFWVMTPLKRDDGSTVLVNRGFVPSDRRDPSGWRLPDPAAIATVTGLLRVTEPGGLPLRPNDPSSDRWSSRDVAAIAAARGLSDVAPYFIDADRTSDPERLPVGGLTVVRFSNNHLVYALTWYALAAMTAAAAVGLTRKAFASTP